MTLDPRSSAPLFFAAEIETYAPPTGTGAVYDQGMGAAPMGALSQFDYSTASSDTVRVSDAGWRSSPADGQGVIPYPPLLNSAFQISRQMNLDPTQSSVAAGWGNLEIRNADGQFDSYVAAHNCDGRPLAVLAGQKVFEPGDQRSGRTTTGTYVDSSGKIQTAPAYTPRPQWVDGVYSGLLDEPAATNLFPNSLTFGAGWNGGANSAVPSNDVPPPFPGATVMKHIRTTSADSNVGYAFANGLEPNGVSYCAAPWLYIPSAFSGSVALNAELSAHLIKAGAVVDMTKRDQWQRVSCSAAGDTFNTATTWAFVLRSIADAGQVLYSACWQIEQGSAPTSYIPTNGAVAARDADKLYTGRKIWLDPPKANLTTVFQGLATQWQLNADTLLVPLRDATYWIEQPLQSALYGGTGGLDGGPDLTGKPKPITRGGTAANPVRQISPVLVDATNLIYQYTDGPGTVVTLYEGADDTNITFAGDYPDITAQSAPPGQYITSNAHGYFRLGTKPVRQITIDATGQFPAAGAISTPIRLAHYLLAETLALPAAYIDAAFDAPDASNAFAAGVYFGPTPVAGHEAIDAVLASIGAKLIPTRAGTLKPFVLRVVAGTPVAAFTPANTADMSAQPLPSTLDPPPYRWRVGYQHAYTTQNPANLSPAASAANTTFVQNADRFAAWASTTVLAQFLRPNDPAPITGCLLAPDGAQAVADALGALWGVRRRLYNVEVPLPVALARDIGDVVSLTWPADDLRAGVLGQIVGEQIRTDQATSTLLVLV